MVATQSFASKSTASTFSEMERVSLDGHDGYDPFQALFRHGDIEECVPADEGFGDPLSENGVHFRHIE